MDSLRWISLLLSMWALSALSFSGAAVELNSGIADPAPEFEDDPVHTLETFDNVDEHDLSKLEEFLTRSSEPFSDGESSGESLPALPTGVPLTQSVERSRGEKHGIVRQKREASPSAYPGGSHPTTKKKKYEKDHKLSFNKGGYDKKGKQLKKGSYGYKKFSGYKESGYKKYGDWKKGKYSNVGVKKHGKGKKKKHGKHAKVKKGTAKGFKGEKYHHGEHKFEKYGGYEEYGYKKQDAQKKFKDFKKKGSDKAWKGGNSKISKKKKKGGKHHDPSGSSASLSGSSAGQRDYGDYPVAAYATSEDGQQSGDGVSSDFDYNYDYPEGKSDNRPTAPKPTSFFDDHSESAEAATKRTGQVSSSYDRPMDVYVPSYDSIRPDVRDPRGYEHDHAAYLRSDDGYGDSIDFRPSLSSSIFKKQPQYDDSLYGKYGANNRAPTWSDDVRSANKYGSGVDVDAGFGTINHGYERPPNDQSYREDYNSPSPGAGGQPTSQGYETARRVPTTKNQQEDEMGLDDEAYVDHLEKHAIAEDSAEGQERYSPGEEEKTKQQYQYTSPSAGFLDNKGFMGQFNFDDPSQDAQFDFHEY